MRQSLWTAVTIALLASGAAAQPAGQAGPWQTYDTSGGEWRSYAGSIGGQKYSPLDQIDAGNFADLEIAWEWLSVDRRISRTTPGGGEWSAPLDTVVDTLVADTPDLYRTGHRPLSSRLQATPLMVDGVLYFNTPLSQGVAVDATTGETLWVFNPKAYEEGTPTMSNPWTQRGVAYWTDGAGDERIFWGTGNGYLVCVRAKTGRPCPDFGPAGSGMVDAMAGLPRGRPCGPRLPQRHAVRDPLAADRRPRPRDPRLAGRRPPHHEGGGARLGPRLGRAHRRARLGLPYRAERHRRVRRPTPG